MDKFASILACPKGSRPFILDLTCSRRNCIMRNELLTVVHISKLDYHYLFCAKCLLWMDTVALWWLKSFKKLEGQISKWQCRSCRR